MELLEVEAKKSIINPPLSAALEARLERDFKPRFFGTWKGRFAVQGARPGSDSIRLDGNDYLAVTGHPHIVSAQLSALKGDSDFVVQSGVFLHDEHPVRQLELMMAEWVGKDDGFVCQSGYAANVGLIQAVADASTPVYLDSMAHASLWEGAHAARAPAFSFQHNDPRRLERAIAKNGPGLVVVDAVYSTTGALCPLKEMLDVIEATGSMILVDESHSLGTHGPRGAGLCAELGVTERVHFISASMAKAMAGRAGFFTAPARIRHHILTTSFPNIFSSCVLPHEAVGFQATVRVLQDADEDRARLHAITRRVRERLTELGYPVEQGTEQIIALEAGPEEDTIELRDELDRYGVHTAFFCAPATSTNRSLARMTLNSALTDAEIDRLLVVMEELAPVIKPWNWPCARRQKVSAMKH